MDQRRSVETTYTPFAYPFDDKVPPLTQWRRVRTLSEEIQMTRSPITEQHWYDWITEIFKKPSAEKLAYREYEEARRNLLQSQRMRDYYESMVKFETQRIKRLRKILDAA